MLCLVARRAMLLLFAVMFMCTRQRQLLMLRWVSFVGTSTHRMLTVMAREKGGGREGIETERRSVTMAVRWRRSWRTVVSGSLWMLLLRRRRRRRRRRKVYAKLTQ